MKVRPGKRPIWKRQRARGVALVVVLGMLVLVLVLVVAFLSSVSVELQSAKKYSSGSDARALADSAVSLVITQIQDATTTPQLAWASQPGMIRTYDSQGGLDTAYKLYSSGKLRVTGSFDPVAVQGSEVPATWSEQTSLYTDLNKPLAVSGTNQYPILDPSAVAQNVSGGVALSGSSPIEGCFINMAEPAVAVNSNQPNSVPMPVQWMYVLQSGKLTSMDPGTKKVDGASKSDPIVGRVAFWTDDESSKVNINTASEGTFWDRSWAKTTYEDLLNTSMPLQNEFQRYPGHPAMTSLSPIFPALSGESARDYNERIYKIIPRVAGGGSESGTVMDTGTNAPKVASPVPDGDRLFASVDEFFFSATAMSGGKRVANSSGPSTTFSVEDVEKARFFLTANSRSPEVNLFNKPRISLWPLQIDPDPGDGSKTRTAKDKLIAFCSTIGGIPYYFQRYNTYIFEKNTRPAGTSNWANKQNPIPSSQSPNMDWSNIPRNRQLFSYLQDLMSRDIPGLGGSLASKYPVSKDQILVEMIDYIRSSVNPQRTLDNKVVSGEDDVEYFYAPGYKRVTPAYFNVIGQQQVAPLVVKQGSSIIGKGFGRFPSVKQAVLVFQASDKNEFRTMVRPSDGKIVTDTATMKKNPLKMKAVLLLDPFHVTPGQPVFCPNVRYRVSWVDEMNQPAPCKVNGIALDFPAVASNLVTARDTELNLTALGGIEYNYKYYEKPSSNDSDHSELPKRLGQPTVGAQDEEEFYPFYTLSDISIPGVPTGDPTFEFTGGKLKIEIFAGYSAGVDESDLVQTLYMAFPSTPVNLIRPSIEPSSDTPPVANKWTDFNERLKSPGLEPGYNHGLKPLIRNIYDTVRSVEAVPNTPARGDFRVYAALETVPSSYFGVAPGYDATANQRLHSLRIYPYNVNGNNSTYYNGFNKTRLGKLVPEATYYTDTTANEIFGNPIVPSDLAGAVMNNGQPGDWDTGPGNQVDGPYINKADMGNNGRFTSYFGTGNNAQTWMPNENGATYSPNRQISSAVSFGSLPTGINPNDPGNVAPWQTLLFCKNPAAGSLHPGFGSGSSDGAPPYQKPPDHAFLDFFTMPIVEPYAISEPFSTAGKVNMNYQIVPFTYLTRDTGVRAVLKSTRVMAIPTGDGLIYKRAGGSDYRYSINPDEKDGTLSGFEERFRKGDIFRSASEICDIFLVPDRTSAGVSAGGNAEYTSMDNWWEGYKLTGDNVREQPYGHIYPRLTTKSNTYTVHVQAQSILKSVNSSVDEFVEGKDQVNGEFRGSFLIERYLDPNSDSLVGADNKSPASELADDAMVGPYKFRVISTKKFTP